MTGPPTPNPGKILLISTLGSGKTTLAELLARDYCIPFASIDACRVRYGDGTMDGEDCAYDHFLARCKKPGPCIIEFSGIGPHVRDVRDALIQSGTPVMVVWLVLPEIVCITRTKRRRKTIAFPYFPAPPESAVPAIHAAIEKAWKTLWSTEPGFRATRLEFSGTEPPDEVCSVVRSICGISG